MSEKEIIALGWELKYKDIDITNRNMHFIFDEYIMAVRFNYEGDFHLVSIKDAEGVNVNVWLNSAQMFYGMIKTPSELKDIMRFIGIIEY